MDTIEDIETYVRQIAKKAAMATKEIARADVGTKNRILQSIIETLTAKKKQLLAANQMDVAQAKQNGISDALLDRLQLDDSRFNALLESCEQVKILPDPIGSLSQSRILDSGLRLAKMRVPLGVIGIVYESRPNVTLDVSILALKSGNASILKGGSEAFNSNQMLTHIVQSAIEQHGLSPDIVQSIATNNRSAVSILLKMHQWVDVMIPRGGKGLVQKVTDEATMPVIKHLDGNCHVYIDNHARDDIAIAIAENAKTRRYGVCNAMETLLVHQSKIDTCLRPLVEKYQAKQVVLRGCEQTRKHFPEMEIADEADWETEYLAPILAIRLVTSIDEAIDHINRYGSHHTDAIVSDYLPHTEKFVNEVDSSSVMVNASTSFADGFEYGLGAEVGISTDKFHVRGPVGLEGLTTQKFVITGNGHCRS